MKIKINTTKCKGCGFCVLFCKNKVLKLTDKPDKNGARIVFVDLEDKCTGCKMCLLMCPDNAIKLEGK